MKLQEPHTDSVNDAYLLGYAMQALSRKYYASQWEPGLEYKLWHDKKVLSSQEKLMMRYAYARAGGMWSWSDPMSEGPIFVPSDAWERAVRAHA